MTRHYTLMSCNGLEWIQPPGNQSRIPGAWAYHDPPAAIVEELNRLIDRIKQMEEAGDNLESKKIPTIEDRKAWRKAKEAKL